MRLLLLVALLIASCQSASGPGIEGVETHFRAAAKLPSTGLGTSVQALLDKRGWTTATEVESAASAERDLWIDAAELRFLQAENENAYLLSARDAWRWLSLTRGGRAEPAEQKERALRIYNHATAAFVLRFRKGLPLKSLGVIRVRRSREGIDPKQFDSLATAYSVSTRGYAKRVVSAGLGAPFIGIRRHTEKRDRDDPYLPPVDHARAITAVLHFGERGAELRFHDPAEETTVSAFGYVMPLAGDFTAPLAYVASRLDAESAKRRATTHPDFAQASIRMPDAPAAGKIPVVLVHGLFRGPGDFRRMVNQLRADPQIRTRYQFIGYRYAPGFPLPLITLDFRERLDTFWQWFDSRVPRARKDGYIVIGHSMGGLVARSLAVRSEDSLWSTMFRVPPDQVDLSTPLGQRVRKSLVFEPDPKLARLIFIATPHRGTGVASSGVGELAMMAIHQNEELAELARQVEEQFADVLRPEVRTRLRGKPNGIQNLSPEDSFLRVYGTLPIDPGVPFDSVIGDIYGSDARPVGDGVVSYKSAHLEGAASETILRLGHHMHQKPAGIEAVHRILLDHLSSR